MKKELLKNAWILAGLILVINLVLGLIFQVIFILLKTTNYLSSVAGLLSAYLVGYVYSSNFRQIMPKHLRFNTTVIYIIAGIIIGGISLSLVVEQFNYVLMAILLGTNLLYAVIIYFMLGLAGKYVLAKHKKKK